MLETIKGRVLLAMVLILLGFGLGMVYVVASGAQGETITYEIPLEVKGIWVGEAPRLTHEERIRLEEQAIDLALSDPRVKELVDAKQYRVVSNVGLKIRVIDETKEDEYMILRCEWDGKIRALVTIIFADGSGFSVDVNLTDGTVEDIRYDLMILPPP